MPEFVGGDIELSKFLSKNILYPKLAKENNIDPESNLTYTDATHQ